VNKYFHFRRIKKIPKKELAGRLFRYVLRTTGNYFREARVRTFPSQLPAKDAEASHVASNIWRGVSVKGLFLSSEEWQSRILLLDDVSPNIKPLIITEADRICEHIFDLLGSGPYKFGESLDWHLDFKSDYNFDPGVYYKRIHPARYPGGYDIKVPWELSRCQHFARLGQAYQISGDEKYAREFVAQVEDWIESNPWPYGVNWNCSMEVALRAINWLWGLSFFIDSSHVDDHFLAEVAQSLYSHAEHIFKNLELSKESGYAGNHYVSNLVGLIYLGIACPFFTRSQTWLSFGLAALSKVITTQVWPDGVDFESSISYHRLVTELMLSMVWLCQQNSVDIPSIVLDRLEKMLEFTRYYTKPDGTVPNIGDQDNGRVHRLGVWQEVGREWLDHQYLVKIGKTLLGNEDGARLSDGGCGEAIWWLGDEGLHSSQKANVSSCAFPESGFYVMRHADLYLTLRAAENGTCGLGGHTHNDIFSFELFAYGKTFIVDPGSYAYTDDAPTRNQFRSSGYHNGLIVDGKEINRIPEQELFRLENDAQAEILNWESNPDFDYFCAQHTGYRRLESPVIHRRSIYFDKKVGYWLVRDQVFGEGAHKLALNFRFMPMGLERDQNDGSLFYSVCEDGANLALWLKEQNSDCLKLEDGWISRSYGTRLKAPLINWESSVELPFELLTVLYPYFKEPPSRDKLELLGDLQLPSL
jgi:hypothetical protein